MLRVSAMTTGTEIDLGAINGDLDAAAVGIEHGPELVRFAASVAGGAGAKAAELRESREALLDAAGAAVLVDAAGVAANFQRMVRIANATGIPVDDMTSELGLAVRSELDIAKFPSAQHSLPS